MSDADRRPSDPRADALRVRYHAHFAAPQIPVPVEAIAADLLGLWVEDVEDLHVSGMLIPSERRILLNARESAESPERRRFTLAHEIGHWVCQCDEGRVEVADILCRGADITAEAARAAEREANNFAATLLMPQDEVTHEGADRKTFGVSPEAWTWRLFNLRG